MISTVAKYLSAGRRTRQTDPVIAARVSIIEPHVSRSATRGPISPHRTRHCRVWPVGSACARKFRLHVRQSCPHHPEDH
ncbi:hypothetical protein GGD56_000864 [Rhizobium mongolense]|uniref:Uncharacterized protein n=1 Tax=Rhizobium mongolense TaxID=57676 RepID=A0ABR6IHG9_9HYPH|nr:hypothetical protein [Rhizobium mongolense]